MVRIVARCVAVLALLFPLASCIFFASAFPPTLAQVVARTDLSTVIPAGSAENYRVYCVTASAAPPGEFVLLMNKDFSGDPIVVVLDSSLNLIQTYNILLLNGPGWGNGTFNGNSLMADAGGNVEIGTLGFSADELRNVLWSPSWTANPSVYGPSFCSPSAQKNDINFRVIGNDLYYDQFHWWGAPNFTSLGKPVNSAGGNYRVEAAYNVDDTPAAGEVLLVLSGQNNSSNVTFVAIPLFDIVNNGVLWPILDMYPNASFNNIDSSSIVFAGDCLVAYSYDSHALVRYSLTPPFKEIGTLPVGQSPHPLSYASKADGSYSIQFDQTTRVLTKVAKWW